MAKEKVKKDRSEAKRKFIVALKKRPHNIPLVFMAVTFVVFSFSLTKISNTTAVINKPLMGLCGFMVMLFSVLAFVCFLNAYPKRQKPKLPMVILLYLLECICVVADIVYVLRINEGLKTIKINAARAFIPQTRVILIIHAAMLVISIVLIALIPVFKKQLSKIDTSVKLTGNDDISNIELSEDE